MNSSFGNFRTAPSDMATVVTTMMPDATTPHASASHWPRVRVLSGDARVLLLRAHQVLVAREDALCHGMRSFHQLVLHSRSKRSSHPRDSAVRLEIVVDQRSHGHGGLAHGTVQVNGWVMDVLRLYDGDCVDVHAAADRTQRESRRMRDVTMAVVARYPERTAHTSAPSLATAWASEDDDDEVAQGDSGSSNSGGAGLLMLPESVRTGLVDLSSAISRQLLAMYADAVLNVGELVPIQLMGETYVLRVVEVTLIEPVEPQVGDAVAVRVLGMRHPQEAASVGAITSSVSRLTLADDSDSVLQARLWRRGCVGYIAFIKDVLFHIQLNLADTAHVPHGLACHGILLHGAQGVGKSLALHVLASELVRARVATWRVDAMSLLMEFENSKVASAFEFLTTQFQQFIPAYSPSQTSSSSSHTGVAGIVLIDDVDVLFRPTSGQQAEAEDDRNLLLMPLGSALLRIFDAMIDPATTSTQRLCVVGTTTTSAAGSDGADDAAVPLAVKRSGRFDKSIEMIVPTEAMRREILARHLDGMPLHALHTGSENERPAVDKPTHATSLAWATASRLAALTGGYVAKDLVRICRNAYVHAHRRHGYQVTSDVSPRTVSWEHLVHAQRQITPTQLRELNVASPSMDGGGSDGASFAGYSALVKQLRELIEWKFQPTLAMKNLGVANASGVLVHGPSGCGKSLLVKALAAQAKVNFVSVKSSELLSKYFGDSERAVRQLFARARAASPCLLFFDEFDAIAHKRSFGDGDSGGGDGGGVYARMLSTFLNEMDGVGAQRGASGVSTGSGEILVIAATNRYQALDAALIRPGRIDKAVELGFPDVEDRLAIFRHYTKRMPTAQDVNLEALASRMTGSRQLTGADIAAICKEAAFRSLREDIQAGTVEWRHFTDAWDQRARLHVS